MPIMLKRKNGEIKPLKHSPYLPAYYFIPKELLDRCPEPLRKIPRCLGKLIRDEEAVATLESDLFENLMMDAFAFMVWPFMGRREYMQIWSGYDSLWLFAHDCDTWITGLTEAGIIPTEDWILTDMYVDIGFLSLESINVILSIYVPLIMAKYDMPAVERIIEENRCFEDFDFRNSRQKIDFYRKWYHTRTQHPQISLEGFQEEYAETHNGKQWDAPDESADLAETVESSAFVEDFLKTLSPTDRRIVELRMEDVTLEEIAKEVGFKTHSAVLKRLKRIGKKYLEYAKEE